MRLNQKGFTLTESLVVLSIFMILSSITVFSLKPQYSSIEDEAFLAQLQADLYYAQTWAISNQTEVTVIFVQNEYFYYIYYARGKPKLVERHYSKKFYLSEGSIPLTFNFTKNGNVNKFGSFFIRTPKKNYKMTILIGRGRFYVSEQ